jgi:hypothetical protein
MNLDFAVTSLARNRERLQSLIEGLTEDQVRYKPGPGAWSVLEVVNHLHDEEREDFRVRLDFTLHRPGQPWPPIDPEGWVVQRAYAARDFRPSWEGFVQERQASLTWLGGLGEVDWERSYEHPKAGIIRAGDILASWTVHDLLHMRQIIHLQFEHARQAFEPYSTVYAGDW